MDQYIRIPATSAISKDSSSFVFVEQHFGKVVGHPHRIMQREKCGIDLVTTPRTFLSTLRRGVKSHHFGLLGIGTKPLEVVRASASPLGAKEAHSPAIHDELILACNYQNAL